MGPAAVLGFHVGSFMHGHDAEWAGYPIRYEEGSYRYSREGTVCSALDPIATAIIEDLIDELKRQYSIAIVTHSMQQASRVSQRTAYFHLGNLIEVGNTAQIFTNPRHQLTQDYITDRFG